MSTASPDVLDPVPVCAALADESRWRILTELGREPLSASELATRLPISRQAIARHLAQLEGAGLVEPQRAGRQIRYVALGARLGQLADALDAIGRGWERRLDRLKRLAEAAVDDESR